MKLQALREKRAGLIADMRGILDGATKEDRDLTDDEAAKYDSMKADVAKLDKKITREEDLAGLENSLSEPVPAISRRAGIERPKGPEAKREFESLGEFMHAVRFNPNDQRLDYVERDPGNMQASEQRMDTGTSGGFMVPVQFRNTLMQVDPQAAVFRSRATVLDAGTPPDAAVSIPALDQTGSAPANMYGGVTVQWTGETGTVQESNFKLREITLQPREMTGSIPISNKLLMNWPAASAFLEKQLRGAVTSAEEFAFLKGDGVAKPLGILSSGASYGVNRGTSNTVVYADIVAMNARLKGNGVWFYNRSVLPQLQTMKDDMGRLIWQPNAVAGQPSLLLGNPAIENERNPQLGSKGDLVLADMSYYLIKDGSGPLIAASEHVYFTTNKTLVKIIWNVDGQSWLTAPITQEGGYQVSPFVILDVPA